MRTCSTISSSVLGRPDQHSSAAAIAGDWAFSSAVGTRNFNFLKKAAEGVPLKMGVLLLLKLGSILHG
jgi:hypothetical protein